MYSFDKMRRIKDSIIEKIPLSFNINPNTLTTFSLISALLAVYFLFVNHILFVVFVLLHLLIDIFDGFVARKTKKTTKFGYWYDNITDNLFILLVFLKYVFYFAAYYSIIIVILFLIYYILRIFAPKKPMIFTPRTPLVITFIFEWYIIGIGYAGLSVFIGIIYLIATWKKKK